MVTIQATGVFSMEELSGAVDVELWGLEGEEEEEEEKSEEEEEGEKVEEN